MASKQYIIIGLGNSAIFLARHLTSLGHDVLVVDNHPEKVQDISSTVSQAMVADSTRKKQLARLYWREPGSKPPHRAEPEGTRRQAHHREVQ